MADNNDTLEKKMYIMSVVFKTPIEGEGVVQADSEEEAIEKTLEAYKDQEDVHVTSVREVEDEDQLEVYRQYFQEDSDTSETLH